MKKCLFLAIFSVFCLILTDIALPVLVEAGHDCRPVRTPYQTNWICGNELFTGHIGTGGYGHGHGGYRHPRHHRDYGYGSSNLGEAILGGIIGGATVVILNNVLSQPTLPPAPVYPVPTPTTRRESCGSTTCVYVSGGSEDAVRAVKRTLLERSYTVANSRGDADYEIMVSEKHIGDPTVRVYLEMVEVRSNVVKSTSTGESRYPRGSELKKLDAIASAAADAVGKL